MKSYALVLVLLISMQMDKVICKTYLLDLQMENVICTCIYNILIYADGYDHLQNLLVILYRWMKSSALVHNVKLISVQMDKFICNYTCLVLIYMLMDVVICTCIYVFILFMQMHKVPCNLTHVVLISMQMDKVICTTYCVEYLDG